MYATIILKIIVCVILLIVYFTLFGYHSLRRYLNGDVIIRRYMLSSEYLQPPGYLIFYISFPLASQYLDVYLAPLNRQTGQPSKTKSNNKTRDYLMESFTNCSDKVDEELKKCLETIAYSNEETVLSTNHRGYNTTQFSFGLYQA